MLLLAAGAACLAGAPEPVGPELLANGSFEAVEKERNLPVGWQGFSTRDWGDCAGTLTVSSRTPREGKRCVELSAVRTQYALTPATRVTVAAGRAYLLTAWVRTELARGEAAFVAASWSSDERWLSLDRSRALRGRQPWTQVQLLLRPEARPAEATRLQVSFRVTGERERGRAWVDAVSLRACRVPPPPPMAELERRRLLDMARELLVERSVWAERLAVLGRRRADLERLVAETGSFDDLVGRHGGAVAERTFLTHAARPRSEFEAKALGGDAAVRAQVGRLAELPELRRKCFDELEALLRLKRQLDARPGLRRFHLWAQLHALRITDPEPWPAPPPRLSAEFAAALAAPPEEPSGELVDLDVRTRFDRRADRGSVTVQAPARRTQGETFGAGLFGPDGKPVAFGSLGLGKEPAALELRVDQPAWWFPDCPWLYTLRVGLFRQGEAVDWLEQPVAFREIRIVECDVSPTMRHAWAWAPADYTFAVNGQPYFPQGTVCGALSREHLDEAATLFKELWLDFQRTYGTWLPRLDGPFGDVFARHGLSYLASVRPDYTRIRSYASSRAGLDDYRALVRGSRALASHPAVLTLEIGNEAELPVWGADLQSVYGRDLWHGFNEAARVLREEAEPTVPVGYVRAAHFGHVLPVPREDYSGVNQYTGRYWGRRATISADLAALAQQAALDHKPVAITEWNGPKYSWATAGVSGVDEQGAAQYVFDYFRRMTRTPGIVLSTEFVLNWIVTPVEDLTTVPLAEGLRRRAAWSWSLQQGTPWYPRIWPKLLTDTPARRAMRGFQSPLFTLCSTPGDIVVASAKGNVDELVHCFAPLGRRAAARAMPTPEELATLDASLVLIGGIGDAQPAAIRALETRGVIGRTTAHFPPPLDYLIQRRVHPYFPDRALVVVTASTPKGMARALEQLAASAGGLAEALRRHASCRRAIALVDGDADTRRAFARYVLELPTRGQFLGWDDLRTRLGRGELVDDAGRLRPHWHDLRAVIVAARRKLSAEERGLLEQLPALGVHVVWSVAALETDPELGKALGVELGPRRPLSGHYAVAPWAQKPLAVPELGDVAAGRVARFSGVKTKSTEWKRALSVREIVAPQWLPAATTVTGVPVVAFRIQGSGAHWAFGADLAAAARVLWRTTHRGVTHRIYDRDTASGLERLFRLVANAAAGHAPRRPDLPRLRAIIETDRLSYAPGDVVRLTIRVRESDGTPRDAAVRIGFAPAGGRADDATPRRWAQAVRRSKGLYALEAPVPKEPADDALIPITPANGHFRGQRLLAVFAHVTREGWVSDWLTAVVRVTPETSEAAHLAELADLIRSGRVTARLDVNDTARWVEVAATLALPAAGRAGQPLRMRLAIDKVESDVGNDWMEEIALVLRARDGREAVLPVGPGRIVAAPKASPVRDRADRTTVVDSAHPARFDLVWPKPQPGIWSLALRYRYTDDYHVKDTHRLARDDAFPGMTIEVAK